jgi:hypothetical protein
MNKRVAETTIISPTSEVLIELILTSNNEVVCADKTIKSAAVEVSYFRGKQGKDGYTPVRGVDYFTDADVAAMVDAVAARFVDGDKEAY